jgi:predicted SprT family Zn-dependent metalloprotease
MAINKADARELAEEVRAFVISRVVATMSASAAIPVVELIRRVEIVVIDRINSYAGKFEASRPGAKKEVFRLTLNLRLIRDMSEARETLCHEFAHGVERFMFGVMRAHGEMWLKIMETFGYPNAKACGSIKAADIPGYVVRIACSCGEQDVKYTWRAKLNKHPGRYLCRKCDQPFRLAAA